GEPRASEPTAGESVSSGRPACSCPTRPEPCGSGATCSNPFCPGAARRWRREKAMRLETKTTFEEADSQMSIVNRMHRYRIFILVVVVGVVFGMSSQLAAQATSPAQFSSADEALRALVSA